MSSFSIEPDKINAVGSNMDDIGRELKQISREIETIKNNLDLASGSTEFIRTAMSRVQNSLQTEASGSNAIGNALREVVRLYDQADKTLAGMEVQGNHSLLERGRGLLQKIRDWIRRLLELIGIVPGGSNGDSAYVGDPVNACTGNYVSDIRELCFSGETALAFIRHYNSLYLQDGPMGKGWTHNYEISLEQGEGTLDLILGNQWRERFSYEESGIYISRHNRFDCISLQESEDGDIREYIYIHESGQTYYFDTEGHITRISMPNGRGIDFSYEDGRLVKAQDSGSRAFFYHYDPEGHLTQVMDHTGRTISMEYLSGCLVGVISADGRGKNYTYDEAGRLEGITDHSGTMVIWNAYDEENRVIMQKLPNNTTMSYEYNGDEVTVTDRNGAVTTYRHNDFFQITDIICSDGTKSYVYDENHQRTEAVYPDGGVYRKEYDSEGNIVCLTDPENNRVEMQYVKRGLPSQIREKNGGISRMEYNADGNIIIHEDAMGNVTHFEYEQGLLSAVIHPDQSRVSFERDENGNIVRRTDETGRVTEFSFDEAGRMVQMTEPGSAIWQYSYDPCDRILSVTNPAGDTRAYTYSDTGKISAIEDFDGSVRQWSYNELDLVSSYVDRNGAVTTYSYDENGNLSEIDMPNGGRIRHKYDGYNRRISTVDELGLETSYEYDPAGRLIREKSGDYTRTLEYDLCGRLLKRTEKDGSSSSVTYDGMGNITRLVRADGSSFSYEYDLNGRCIRKTDPAGCVTEYDYDCMSRLVEIRRSGMLLQGYTYYADGQVKTVRSSQGEGRTCFYDEAGDLIRTVSETGYSMDYEYDCLHRRTAMRDSCGRTVSYVYDAVGNATERVDENGNITFYRYSASGKLLAVENADSVLAQYEYDEMDRLSRLLQGDGAEMRVTSLERNARGQLTKITDAAGCEDRYTYNEYGQMILHETPEALHTRYTYDELGRTKSILYDDGRTVQFTHDAMGRMTGMEDWNGHMDVDYDSMGRPVRIRNAAGKEMLYQWDEAGHRTGMRYPDGKEVFFHRDPAGKLAEIDSEAGVIRYTYDDAGRILTKRAEQGMVEYDYLQDGHVGTITYSDSEGILSKLSLSYDASGNVKEKVLYNAKDGSEKRTSYEYDTYGRLTAVYEDGNPVRAYGYDVFGNRVFEQRQGERIVSEYDRLNQLIRQTVKREADSEDGEMLWTYNKDGNAVTFQGENTSYQLDYDSAGKLARVFDDRGNVASYVYDGLGMRYAETGNRDAQSVRRAYFNDFTQEHSPLVYTEESGYSSDYIYDGELAAALRDGQQYFYHCDQQGSVLRYLSDSHSVQEYCYDEFGRDVLGTAGHGQPFGYTGLPYDSAMNCWHTPARSYSPLAGRFLQRDEERYIHIGQPQSINLYSYCLNNPLLYVDPDGTDCYIFYLPEWRDEALNDQQRLAEQYGYGTEQVHLIPVQNAQQLRDGWNGMGTVDGRSVDIDTVVINTHANPERLGFGNGNSFSRRDAMALQDKEMEQLVLYGCNAGHLDYQDRNIAEAFSHRTSGAPVMASDGTVYGMNSDETYTPRSDEEFQYWADRAGNGGRSNEGWQIYRQVDGQTVVTNTGMFAATVVMMLDSLRSYAAKNQAE